MEADWLLFPDYWQVNGLYYGMKKAIFPSISTQPVLYVQEYLPIDRDMRLVVIGRNVVAGYLRCRPTADGFHTNVAKGGFIFTDEIPAAAVTLVEEMARTLDIDYAGVLKSSLRSPNCFILLYNPRG